MSYADRKRSLWHQWESDEADESITRRSGSPGKRTLTMSLPPRSVNPLVSGQAPVQQKADPAAVMQRKEQAVLTEQWMNTAFRPDLYDAPVQRKSAGDREGDQASTSLPADGGQPMPEDVQTKMEGAFGTDFSAVRIHEGPQTTSMGALAYTQGTDIHFAPGQYEPGSQRGQELLGHELTHVVQQSQGRVQATTQAKGVDMNDDAALEQEADQMAAMMIARGQTAAPAAGMAHGAAPAPVLQRKPVNNTGQQGDAGTDGEHEGDASPDADGLSPGARAILQRLNLQPNLPPDAMVNMSRGFEQIAEQMASFPPGAAVGEQMSFEVVESDWRLALRIGIDPPTGAVQIELAFQDGESVGFSGSFRTTPPQPIEKAAPGQELRLDGEIPNLETRNIESPPAVTPLDVARFLLAESTDIQIGAQGEDGFASPELASAGEAQPEEAMAKAELEQTEAEIAAVEKELSQLAADTAIDLAGIVDPTPISDGVAMARDLSRGDYFGALLSGVSMFPWLGDAVAKPFKGARILDKVNDARRLLANLRKRAISLRKRLRKPVKLPAGPSKLPEVPELKTPNLDKGNMPGAGPETPKASSDAKNQWQKQAHDKRTSDRAKEIDQPLEPTNSKKSTHGHGNADHGAQTTAADQANRVETGTTPSGRKTPKGKPASRFHSPEAELEALGRARHKLDVDRPPKYDPATGEPNRIMYEVETKMPDGFGTRHVPKKDAAGNKVKPYEAEADSSILRRAKVIFEYVPSKDEWYPVTYYPIP